MKAFDARCANCGGVHVVWVAWDHEPGDVVKYAHARTPGSCGEYVEHRLEASLDGMSKHEKWGPNAGPADA